MAQYNWIHLLAIESLAHYSDFPQVLTDRVRELLKADPATDIEVGQMWYMGQWHYKIRYKQPERPRVRCNQCEAAMINGVFCHEHGCPNIGAKYIDGDWVKFRKCFVCGYDVRDGEVCDCQQPIEDED